MLNYDFTNICISIKHILDEGPTPSDLNNIKKELNKFFKDSECREVLYTNNTDKMFFGAKTIATINADNIYEYLADDEKIRLTSYIIELDSHLFNPLLGLNEKEILAVLLHEIGHLVNDTTPIENARNALNEYLAYNKDNIKISDSIHYKEILAYGLKDYLSKSGSMFYNDNAAEVYADDFVTAYGLGYELKTAYDKITSNNMKLYADSQISKFTVFAWTLSLYRNMKVRRVGGLKTLARAKQMTGSRLEKLEIENVIKRINRIDDSVLIESSLKVKIKEKMRKSRINTLRIIDNTYCELMLQVKNVEEEDDAIYLMRTINNNISVIDEYANNYNLEDEEEKKRWHAMLQKFVQLRELLMKTAVYKNKNYGIFINYPDIVENRY